MKVFRRKMVRNDGRGCDGIKENDWKGIGLVDIAITIWYF